MRGLVNTSSRFWVERPLHFRQCGLTHRCPGRPEVPPIMQHPSYLDDGHPHMHVAAGLQLLGLLLQRER